VRYLFIGNNKGALSELTAEDWVELGRLEKELERVCKKVFGATMFNFCCLMNNAYRDNEKTKVHYHFVPRYKNELKLFGKVYKDRHFGYNFWKWNLSKFKCQKDPYTQEERLKIFEMMKEEFNLK
jgi:diadenosine tetraphosphate (Ap4A) HIT family hydrolase